MDFVAVIGWPQETNARLVASWRELGLHAVLDGPTTAASLLRPGDVAVGRLDVLRTLDGIEPGLDVLSELSGRGCRVLNGADALLGAHDKLRTATCLAQAGVRHPRTHLLERGAALPVEPPFVLKPRFGSWGADVFRCRTAAERDAVLHEVESRPWFRRQGALVQELVPGSGRDLRLLVAGGRVVGAVQRVAAPGEWRTNISLGGRREPVEPPADARALGVAAAAAIGADFVGVDLLPVDDGYVVLELNGAAEFDETYALAGRNVYLEVARALKLVSTRAAA
jgi:RimK family alpha-L-glutamate ligase